MSQLITTEGHFRGRVMDYSLHKADSGAVAIRVQVALEQWFNPSGREWQDCQHWDRHAIGYFWVVGREGGVLQRAVQDLCDYAGWDGTFASIESRTWQPPPLQFDVRQETYRGNVQYRIGFLQPHGGTPGRTADAHSLDAQFGSQVRAIAASNGAAQPIAKPVIPASLPISRS